MPQHLDSDIEIARARRARARVREREAAPSPETAPTPDTPPAKPRSALRDLLAMNEVALDDFTLGLSGIAGDAASAAVLPGSFRDFRDARRERREGISTGQRLVAGLAGGIASAAIPGFGLLPAAKNATTASIAGKAAITGGLLGGAVTAGEDIGTTAGVDPLKVAMGSAFGFGLGGSAGGAAARIEKVGFAAALDPLRRYTGGPIIKARRLAEKAADAAGARMGGASSHMRLPAEPLRSADPVTGMPEPIAMDLMNPAQLGEVRGAAASAEGREILRQSLNARQKEMPAALRSAFDEATGTTRQSADDLAREIGAAETARGRANVAQKAAYDLEIATLKTQHAEAAAAARAVQKPGAPEPRSMADAIDALRAERGSIPDAIDNLRSDVGTRTATARANYGDFIEATKGKAVASTPEAESFLQSPTGAAAWKAAQRSRADVVSYDPSRALPSGFARTAAGDFTEGPVPDAEAWQFMKIYLRDAAKMDAGTATPEGITATLAQPAKEQFSVVVGTLDPILRQADAVYAADSRLIDASRVGLATAKGNPSPKQSLKTSLNAVELQASGMSPEELIRFREGKQFAIAARFRAGLSPARAAQLLTHPESDLSREVALAFGADAPARLARRLATPDATPFVRPTVAPFIRPPAPGEIPRTSRIDRAIEGLGIRQTPNAPTPGSPTRSLPSLLGEASRMSDRDRTALREGAAAAFRDDLDAGKWLNLSIPERARQFSVAAKDDLSAETMAAVETAWGKVAERRDLVLPSGLAGRAPQDGTLPEQIASAAAPGWTWTLVRAFRDMTSSGSVKAKAAQAAVDELIAKMPGQSQPEFVNFLRDRGVRDIAMRQAGTRGAGVGGRVGGVLDSATVAGGSRRAAGAGRNLAGLLSP